MTPSRPLQELGCVIQATLLNVCLTERDLQQLGLWSDGANRLGFTPAVWCRAALHRQCQGDPDRARGLTDLLDLQFLDTVILVRCMDVGELAGMVDLWVSKPNGQALPGLLWALCTDSRDEVHALGARLCHESVTVAFRSLVQANATSAGAALPGCA